MPRRADNYTLPTKQPFQSFLPLPNTVYQDANRVVFGVRPLKNFCVLYNYPAIRLNFQG